MKSKSIFSPLSLQAYMTLLIVGGISLGISIQPASTISQLRSASISNPPGFFHIAFILLIGLFAVNRGAVLAHDVPRHASRRRILGGLLPHLAFALLLFLPYLIYARALLPTVWGGTLAFVFYALELGLFIGLAALRLEHREGHPSRSGFLLRYGLFIGYCLVPYGVGLAHPALVPIITISPAGMAFHLIDGAVALNTTLGFLTPLVGVLGLLILRSRRTDYRRHHAI